jgi:DNA-directed RNA polymerase specialized sigma24 family protein
MSCDDSVTMWLKGAKAGDNQSIRKLWDRYFQQLVRVASKQLPPHRRRDVDEEDVALSAFHTFCHRAGRGQFLELDRRDDLWRLLVVITKRKVVSIVRNRACQKRGGGRVVGESALHEVSSAGEEPLAHFPGREPSPDLTLQLSDDFTHLMQALGSPSLRLIALLRLEGHTAGEISRSLEISLRSVERKLNLIRTIWEEVSCDII